MGQQLKTCSEHGCRNLIPKGDRYCSIHVKNHEYKPNHKRYDQARKLDRARAERNHFYHTKMWKLARVEALTRDHGLCVYCDLFGDVTPATLVDHVIPREVDGTIELELDNLASSCVACHRIKTDWEQEHYGTGQKNNLNKNALKIYKVENLKPFLKKGRG